MGKQARRQRVARKTHERGRSKRADLFNPRPFAGLATEATWVALRELIPAATAEVRLADAKHADRAITVATVLPMAQPALVKGDGRIFLGVQAHARSGDLSRDLAAVLEAALAARPGSYVALTDLPEPGPRLQDLLADAGAINPTLHDTFGFWLDAEVTDGANSDGTVDDAVTASLERANASILPTHKIADSAYWCQVADRAHLRWVLPDDEDRALAALARLHSAGDLTLGAQTRYAGAFRAHGLLVPVWDLPRDAAADSWADTVERLTKRYQDAVADETPLTTAERQSRSTLAARQLTLR